ncbi:hypothetical protein Trydic_g22223 [Trypoxylus dichotomus]
MTVDTLEEMEDKNADISGNSDTDSEHESDSDQNENVRWADSIAKILKTNKPKGKKTLVLSKGKKLTISTDKKPQKLEFEIEADDGKIKCDTNEKVESKEEVNKLQLRRKKKELPILRKKPNILHKDRERTLCKIATKGVVQLFNSIKSQQIDVNTKLEEAGPVEVKRNKVLKKVDKNTFLDMLMQSQSEKIDQDQIPRIEKKEKTWNVLRDDFMIGAKMKDWDKELEEENMECE